MPTVATHWRQRSMVPKMSSTNLFLIGVCSFLTLINVVKYVGQRSMSTESSPLAMRSLRPTIATTLAPQVADSAAPPVDEDLATVDDGSFRALPPAARRVYDAKLNVSKYEQSAADLLRVWTASHYMYYPDHSMVCVVAGVTPRDGLYAENMAESLFSGTPPSVMFPNVDIHLFLYDATGGRRQLVNNQSSSGDKFLHHVASKVPQFAVGKVTVLSTQKNLIPIAKAIRINAGDSFPSSTYARPDLCEDDACRGIFAAAGVMYAMGSKPCGFMYLANGRTFFTERFASMTEIRDTARVWSRRHLLCDHREEVISVTSRVDPFGRLILPQSGALVPAVMLATGDAFVSMRPSQLSKSCPQSQEWVLTKSNEPILPAANMPNDFVSVIENPYVASGGDEEGAAAYKEHHRSNTTFCVIAKSHKKRPLYAHFFRAIIAANNERTKAAWKVFVLQSDDDQRGGWGKVTEDDRIQNFMASDYIQQSAIDNSGAVVTTLPTDLMSNVLGKGKTLDWYGYTLVDVAIRSHDVISNTCHYFLVANTSSYYTSDFFSLVEEYALSRKKELIAFNAMVQNTPNVFHSKVQQGEIDSSSVVFSRSVFDAVGGFTRNWARVTNVDLAAADGKFVEECAAALGAEKVVLLNTAATMR